MKTGKKIAAVIDEEPHFSQIIASALRMSDFYVSQFYDATSFLNSAQARPPDFSRALMFIDMALEPGSDETIFSIENTNNYMTTGLVLAEKIIDDGLIDTDARSNVILYSAHQLGEYWMDIETFCSTYGTRKWQKRADSDMEEILDLAAHYVR